MPNSIDNPSVWAALITSLFLFGGSITVVIIQSKFQTGRRKSQGKHGTKRKRKKRKRATYASGYGGHNRTGQAYYRDAKPYNRSGERPELVAGTCALLGACVLWFVAQLGTAMKSFIAKLKRDSPTTNTHRGVRQSQ